MVLYITKNKIFKAKHINEELKNYQMKFKIKFPQVLAFYLLD